MSFVLRNINNLDLAGRNFGEGVGEGYMQGSDERAIRKAVDSLPPNASYREILNAVSNVSTFNPKAKQEAVNNLLKSHELDLKEQQANARLNSNIKKEEEKIELDLKEQEFLESIKDKNTSPVQAYHAAREANLPPVSAKRISDLIRLQEKENRINKKNLTDVYDYEIKRTDRLINEETSNKKKRELIEKRNQLEEARRKDLEKWEKGERNFTPEIHREAVPAVQEKVKPRFDGSNPDHQAIARKIFDEIKEGSLEERKEKTREILRQEFEI